MRHHRNTVKFGRQTSHFKATMRGLVSGVIKNKAITTTKTKAKEASRLAEKLVTIAKVDTVASRRKAYSILHDRELVSILFKDIAPLFKDRNGGYTRVMLTQKRKGDNAQLAILEFIEKPKVEPRKEKLDSQKKAKPVSVEEPVKKIEEAEAKVHKKEEVVRKKEEPKKRPEPPREPTKPIDPKHKPGFFKKIFGRTKDK